jgi:hypothetical protein
MSTESPATHGRASAGFSAFVAVGIAVMSAVAALAGWRASLADIEAADLGRRLIQEHMQVEARQLQLDTKVYRDESLFARYQEHVLAEQLLEQDAQNVARRARQLLEHDPQGAGGRGEGDIAATLDMQAQAELAVARALTPFFRVRYPQLTATPGLVQYDAKTALRVLRASDTTLRTIHPEQTAELVDAMHRRTWSLYGVAAVFVISVFFLTLAEFGPLPARTTLALAGAVVIVCGIAGWVYAEALLR